MDGFVARRDARPVELPLEHLHDDAVERGASGQTIVSPSTKLMFVMAPSQMRLSVPTSSASWKPLAWARLA